jgi:diphthamide synthase subunit DPH2
MSLYKDASRCLRFKCILSFCTIVCPRFWADHYTLYTHPLLGSDEVGWSWHLVTAIPEETDCLILSE